MTNEEKECLFSCGLFEGMDAVERERLLHCLGGETAHYDRGEILWHMGDPVHACAVVLSGSVRAESVNAAGEHSVMAVHHPGALVGDVLMATPGGTSPVYTIAAETATVVFLPFGKMMGGCGRCCPAHVRLRVNLISEIAQKYWAVRRKVGYLAEGSLRARIAMYLRDRSQDAESMTFSLGCTREDLAAYLCVNRSALCRELGRMKQEGILDFYRDTFRIDSLEKLAKCIP